MNYKVNSNPQKQLKDVMEMKNIYTKQAFERVNDNWET